MIKRVFIFLNVACIFAIFASSTIAAEGYKKIYKMSVVVGHKLPWGEGAVRFTNLVRERTNGRINIRVYSSSSLMSGKQTFEFLIQRRGVADFCFASTINWSTSLKSLNLFALPFFFPDYAAVDAITQGEVGNDIKQLLNNNGITLLAWGENGFRELTNSKRPVATPRDLDGLKIRVVGTPIFQDIMHAFNANPITMNWNDAQIAFQQKTVDGQENPIVSIDIPIKIWQHQKYATIWRYVIDPLMLTVNNKVFASFTPEDQKIIKQAAIDAAAEQRDMVRKGLIAPDLSALATLRDNGMNVIELDQDAIKAFREKAQPVYEKWVEIIGPDLVEKAKKAIKDSRRQ